MKNFYCLLLLLPALASGQNTFTIHGCAGFWKTGATVPGIALNLQASNSASSTQPSNLLIDVMGTPGTPDTCSMVSISADTIPVNAWWQGTGVPVNVPFDTVNNGVSVVDISCIQRYILGLEPLSSPYSMIAADVNQSGTITGFDLVMIRKWILGLSTPWDQPSGFRSIPASCIFPNPLNPFNVGSWCGGDSTLSSGDTIALVIMKAGDVDGDASWTTPYAGPGTTGTTELLTPEQNVTAGTATVLPFYFPNSSYAEAFQVEIQYDTTILQFDSLATAPNFSFFSYRSFPGGRVRVVLQGQAFVPIDTAFRLHFQVLQNGMISSAIGPSSSGFPALIANGCQGTALVLGIGQTVAAPEVVSKELRIFPAAPNPFTSQTSIRVELAAPTDVLLDIITPDGRSSYSIRQRLAAGQHDLSIPASATPGALAFYRLTAGRTTCTGKLCKQ